MTNTDDKAYAKQYNKLADGYNEFSLSNKEIIYVSDPLLMELIGEIDGLKILDIGCGSGFQLSILRKNNPDTLIGIDISERLIEIGKKKLPDDIKLMVANANAEGFVHVIQSTGTKQFDLIYHNFVQVHNTNLEQMTIFWRNIYRLLEEGGRAIGITSDPNTASPVGADKLMDIAYEFPGGYPVKEGNLFKVHLSPELTVSSYHWTFGTVAKIMEDIGFKDVRQVFAHANDISAQVFSKEQWDIIEKSGAIYALVGTR